MLSDRRLYAVGFLISFLLLLVRAGERIHHGDIWAEDVVILSNALDSGFSSLFTLYPAAGYLFTVQRLICLILLNVFPLRHLPPLIALTSFVIFSAVAGAFAKRDYEWLVPSYAARLACVVLLTLSPGLSEVAGNLCNLNWIFVFGIALIGLKEPSKQIGPWEIILILLASASAGGSILLIPLFSWRLWQSWRAHGAPKQILGNIGSLLVLLAINMLYVLVHPATTAFTLDGWREFVAGYTESLYWSIVYQPWFGSNWGNFMRQDRIWELLTEILFLIFGVRWAWIEWRNPKFQALTLFLSGIALWIVLLCLGRASPKEIGFGFLYEGFWFHRYSFPLGFAATLFWMSAICPNGLFQKGKPSWGAAFLALNLIFAIPRFQIGPLGNERKWKASYAKLESAIQTGCPHRVRVAIYPEGWSYEYISPKNVLCPPAD